MSPNKFLSICKNLSMNMGLEYNFLCVLSSTAVEELFCFVGKWLLLLNPVALVRRIPSRTKDGKINILKTLKKFLLFYFS